MTKRLGWMGLVLCLGCGGESVVALDAPAFDTVESEIIGGRRAYGDLAVGALMVDTGEEVRQYCTGTLIAPRLMLTAAHCVHAFGTDAHYFVAFGSTVKRPRLLRDVVRQEQHPGYDFLEPTDGHDFGLLALDAAPPGIAPLTLNTLPLTDALEGQPIRHVGFGLNNPEDRTGNGVKREVRLPVQRVDELHLTYGAPGKNTCQGDSGAPGLMKLSPHGEETVVGIVSYGDTGCTLYGVDGRADRAVGFVRRVRAQWGL